MEAHRPRELTYTLSHRPFLIQLVLFYHFTKGFRDNLLVDIGIQPKHILGSHVMRDSIAFYRKVVLNLAILNGMKVYTLIDNVKKVALTMLDKIF